MTHLILTPHTELLPKDIEGVILIDEWCLTADFLKEMANRGTVYNVNFSRLNDRSKYAEESVKIESYYEQMLVNVAQSLNSLHAVKKDLRYWRLLLGPALYTLVAHLYDRWSALLSVDKRAYKYIPHFECAGYRFTPEKLLDVDPDSDDYNHYLLANAAKYMQLNVEFLTKERKAVNSALETRGNSSSVQIKSSAPFASKVLQHAGKLWNAHRSRQNSKVFITKSYLPPHVELLLSISLGATFAAHTISWDSSKTINKDARKSIRLGGRPSNSFEEYLCAMISKLIPKAYIEDYEIVQNLWIERNWPNRPEVIFTSTAFQFDEVFQHYAATMQETGTSLVVGQHGGVTGISKWSWGATHQLEISDKFLSWGKRSFRKNVEPSFVLTNLGRHIRYNSQSNELLLVTVPMRRYPHKSNAWPVGFSQAKEFLNSQIQFNKTLKQEITRTLKLRIPVKTDKHYKSGFVNAWTSNFTNIKIDPSITSFWAELKKARLLVYTYNSTGYLQSLSMNFPTIIFWDTENFESNDDFERALLNLEKVGIFFRKGVDAANHINIIWPNVLNWWQSYEVQAAVNQFCNEFARTPKAMDFFRLRKLISPHNVY
jgi:putative transferase (TIGR04331 family)